MIRVALDGRAAIGDLAPLRQEFVSTGMARLPGFLSPDLLRWLQSAVAAAEFVDRTHGTLARDRMMVANPALSLIHFAVNDPALLAAVARVAGVETPGRFLGHVFMLRPGTSDYDSWHSDEGFDRHIGLSVNLTATPYEGGVFQLRDTATGTVLREVANTIPGDAMLFPISSRFQHRASPVTGGVTRLTLAGWFFSGGTLADYLGGPQP